MATSLRLKAPHRAAWAGFTLPPTGRQWGWWGQLLTVLVGLWLAPRPAAATHIVGGQIGMQYVSEGIYDLSFTLYFDALNGNPGALDAQATLVTFERGRGWAGKLDTISLPLFSRQRVNYTTPGCQTSSLITDEIRYSRRVYLDPARYASPNGYYMAWQRFSRNYVITNMGYVQYGVTPPQIQTDIGQTFYLEFPALRTAGGQPFVNSSPTGFRPLRDYACIGRTFRYPFGGIDPDGDSLVYDLVTPLQSVCDSVQLRTNGCSTVPTPGPAPYKPINWAAGYDSLTQIPGSTPLRINRQTGELTFVANQIGLFVFAVRVREYRAGRLLGELRREFQELVLNCPVNQTPNLSLTVPAPPRTGAVLTNGQLITLPAAGSPGERCLNVYASDPDTTTTLRLRLVPIDSLPARPAFSITNGLVNATGRRDSLYSRLCFPDCFSTNGAALRFWVIVEDQGCPAPQPDSVLLLVRAAGVVNAPTTLALSPPQRVFTAGVGQTVALALTGTTSSGLPVTVGAVTLNGSAPTAPGLVLAPVTAPGTAVATLAWTITCDVAPGTYRLLVQAATAGALCNPANGDTATVVVTVLPRPDAPLALRVGSAPQGTAANPVPAPTGATQTLDVFATDPDNDPVVIAVPNLATSPLAAYGLQATATPGPGQAQLRLSWLVGCEVPAGVYRVPIRSTVSPLGCRPTVTADTAVYLRVEPRPDAPLTYRFAFGAAQTGTAANPVPAPTGTTQTLNVFATDPDNDPVAIAVPGLAGSPLATYGLQATATPGPREAQLRLSWVVPCETPPGVYRVLVRSTVSPLSCRPTATVDTAVYIRVEPGTSTFDSNAPNIITPNQDGFNDSFAPQLSRSGAPTDCEAAAFRLLRIYSRWGREVFRTTNGVTGWNGANATDGTYFYLIDYDNRPSVKGWLEVVRGE